MMERTATTRETQDAGFLAFYHRLPEEQRRFTHRMLQRMVDFDETAETAFFETLVETGYSLEDAEKECARCMAEATANPGDWRDFLN